MPDHLQPAALNLGLLANRWLAELKAADVIVIGAPMYNFNVPSTLKSWVDHILIAGETFRYGSGGPIGLLPGKRVIVASSRGSFYNAACADGL